MKKGAGKNFPRCFRGALRLLLFAAAWMFSWCAANASTVKDVFKTTVVLGDFYAWAYIQAFQDKAHAYAWTTAGVDAFGWGLVAASGSREGLFLVNLANTAKLFYPVVRLSGASPREVKHRAWISLGTHAATLLTLRWLGKVEVGVRFSRREKKVFLATRF